MTYVPTSSAFASTSSSSKFFTVEVITFDGESITVEVYAASEAEAIEIAVEDVEGADYAMVQGCY